MNSNNDSNHENQRRLEKLFKDSFHEIYGCDLPNIKDKASVLENYEEFMKIIGTNEINILRNYAEFLQTFIAHAESFFEINRNADQYFIDIVNNLALKIYDKYVNRYMCLPEKLKQLCSEPADIASKIFSFMNKLTIKSDPPAVFLSRPA